MMNAASPDRIRHDRRLIGQTLLKLGLPRLLVRAVVLIVAAIIWLMVASWLLNFGRGLSFEGLQAFGQQAIDLLTRINPYVWWGVVAIWTLIVFFAVRAWIQSDIAASRARPLSATELSSLSSQLSEEVRDVLRWVWGNREEPFTLGDLRQAGIELRHRRIDKIELVREQTAILDGTGEVVTPVLTTRAQAAPVATPIVATPASTTVSSARVSASTPVRPAGAQRIEPNL
ncbi:hypothetical protein [Bordetella sp. 15P40C-2]|uniref:hypothetical protein n=1 Tax=Bordetella sp. 15P40C-2 TaxID=2572246 RepID=UPI001322C4CB|nr:hypothetical protein [Bordetella sp. 15P40C-2]MVW72915.1 hypothetical protein [Bordetella sp. 15P40C-2]